MKSESMKNKIAWEYRAYEFWNLRDGNPKDKAAQIKENSLKCFIKHQKYFHNIKDLKIANLCGSNGRKAVPLAMMGAQVTIFDISEENMKYALELARNADTSIDYVVGDIYDIDIQKYKDYFDILYLEGGILHYFSDIDQFTGILYQISKKNAKLVLSDFHPYRKMIPIGQGGASSLHTSGNYFDCEIHNGEVAYARQFATDEVKDFPTCQLRYYTLAEIINAIISSGFVLKEFIEHPSWNDSKIPGEFTIYAEK